MQRRLEEILTSPVTWLVVATACVYSGTLANGLVYDDNDTILANPWLSDPTHLADIFGSSVWGFAPDSRGTPYYRPLFHVALMLGRGMGGGAAWAYHLVSICLQVAVVTCVYTVAKTLWNGAGEPAPGDVPGRRPHEAVASRWPPVLAAALFAVHPINVESVAWASAVTEPLYAAFGLLALLLHGRTESWARGLGATCLLGALLSKETAVVFFALLVAWDLVRRNRKLPHWKETAGIFLPSVAAGLVYAGLRGAALGGLRPSESTEAPAFELLLTGLSVCGEYFGRLLLPVKLSIIYPFEPVTSLADPSVWWGVSCITALVVLTIVSRKNPRVVFGACLVLLPMLPALSFPVIVAGRVADRYLYLSSAGIAILVTELLWTVSRRAPLARRGLGLVAVSCSLVLALAVAAYSRGRVWRSDTTLFEDAVQKAPRSTVAHNNLGSAHLTSGSYAEAEAAYREAVELDRSNFEALMNLATVVERRGKTTEALELYRRFVAQAPPHLEIHRRRARAAIQRILAVKSGRIP